MLYVVTQPAQRIGAIQGGSIAVANVKNGEGCAVRTELGGHSDR